jgi:hypothetical protein
MANSTNSTIVLTLAQIMATYQIVNDANKLKLEVIGNPSNSSWVNPRLRDGKRGATYKHSFFINLKAIESRKVRSVILAFYEFNGVKMGSLSPEDEKALELPINLFKFNMTKEVIVHTEQDAPELPMKGDLMDCGLGFAMDTRNEDGYARDKNGARILEVKNFVVPKAKVESGVSWSSFTGADDTSADVNAEAVATEEVVADAVVDKRQTVMAEATADDNF